MKWKNCLWPLLGLVIVLISAPASARDGHEKALFVEHCQKCHALSSEGLEPTTKVASMQGGDLSALKRPFDLDALMPYLERKTEKDGKQHKGRFKGSPKDLKAIVDWLGTLEAKKAAVAGRDDR